MKHLHVDRATKKSKNVLPIFLALAAVFLGVVIASNVGAAFTSNAPVAMDDIDNNTALDDPKWWVGAPQDCSTPQSSTNTAYSWDWSLYFNAPNTRCSLLHNNTPKYDISASDAVYGMKLRQSSDLHVSGLVLGDNITSGQPTDVSSSFNTAPNTTDYGVFLEVSHDDFDGDTTARLGYRSNDTTGYTSQTLSGVLADGNWLKVNLTYDSGSSDLEARLEDHQGDSGTVTLPVGNDFNDSTGVYDEIAYFTGSNDDSYMDDLLYPDVSYASKSTAKTDVYTPVGENKINDTRDDLQVYQENATVPLERLQVYDGFEWTANVSQSYIDSLPDGYEVKHRRFLYGYVETAAGAPAGQSITLKEERVKVNGSYTHDWSLDTMDVPAEYFGGGLLQQDYVLRLEAVSVLYVEAPDGSNDGNIYTTVRNVNNIELEQAGIFTRAMRTLKTLLIRAGNALIPDAIRAALLSNIEMLVNNLLFAFNKLFVLLDLVFFIVDTVVRAMTGAVSAILQAVQYGLWTVSNYALDVTYTVDGRIASNVSLMQYLTSNVQSNVNRTSFDYLNDNNITLTDAALNTTTVNYVDTNITTVSGYTIANGTMYTNRTYQLGYEVPATRYNEWPSGSTSLGTYVSAATSFIGTLIKTILPQPVIDAGNAFLGSVSNIVTLAIDIMQYTVAMINYGYQLGWEGVRLALTGYALLKGFVLYSLLSKALSGTISLGTAVNEGIRSIEGDIDRAHRLSYQAHNVLQDLMGILLAIVRTIRSIMPI